MNITSHLLLSNRLGKHIGLDRWDRMWFMLGNILPDLTFSFLRYEHSAAVMSFPVMTQLQKQLEEIENGYDPNYLRFGILTHYLADFFCSVHNHPVGELRQFHYNYERNLNVILSETVIEDTMFPFGFEHSDITQWISEQHNAYLKETFGLKRDAEYIPYICATTAVKFAESIVRNKNRSIMNSAFVQKESA